MTNKVLLDEDNIARLVRSLSVSVDTFVTDKYDPKDVVLIGIMDGALFFLSDFLRSSIYDYSYTIVSSSSYIGNISTKIVSMDNLNDLQKRVKDKVVFLLDEICDTGHTLIATKKRMLDFGAKGVYTVCLLNKKEKREVSITPDFIGLEIEDHFVIGYGLDLDGSHRTTSFIYYKE
jgi:hypoxanthine phosphoribosyltransferase